MPTNLLRAPRVLDPALLLSDVSKTIRVESAMEWCNGLQVMVNRWWTWQKCRHICCLSIASQSTGKRKVVCWTVYCHLHEFEPLFIASLPAVLSQRTYPCMRASTLEQVRWIWDETVSIFGVDIVANRFAREAIFTDVPYRWLVCVSAITKVDHCCEAQKSVNPTIIPVVEHSQIAYGKLYARLFNYLMFGVRFEVLGSVDPSRYHYSNDDSNTNPALTLILTLTPNIPWP